MGGSSQSKPTRKPLNFEHYAIELENARSAAQALLQNNAEFQAAKQYLSKIMVDNLVSSASGPREARAIAIEAIQFLKASQLQDPTYSPKKGGNLVFFKITPGRELEYAEQTERAVEKLLARYVKKCENVGSESIISEIVSGAAVALEVITEKSESVSIGHMSLSSAIAHGPSLNGIHSSSRPIVPMSLHVVQEPSQVHANVSTGHHANLPHLGLAGGAGRGTGSGGTTRVGVGGHAGAHASGSTCGANGEVGIGGTFGLPAMNFDMDVALPFGLGFLVSFLMSWVLDQVSEKYKDTVKMVFGLLGSILCGLGIYFQLTSGVGIVLIVVRVLLSLLGATLGAAFYRLMKENWDAIASQWDRMADYLLPHSDHEHGMEGYVKVGPCQVCFKAPATKALLHGNVAHTYYCPPCWDRWVQQTKKDFLDRNPCTSCGTRQHNVEAKTCASQTCEMPLEFNFQLKCFCNTPLYAAWTIPRKRGSRRCAEYQCQYTGICNSCQEHSNNIIGHWPSAIFPQRALNGRAEFEVYRCHECVDARIPNVVDVHIIPG